MIWFLIKVIALLMAIAIILSYFVVTILLKGIVMIWSLLLILKLLMAWALTIISFWFKVLISLSIIFTTLFTTISLLNHIAVLLKQPLSPMNVNSLIY